MFNHGGRNLFPSSMVQFTQSSKQLSIFRIAPSTDMKLLNVLTINIQSIYWPCTVAIIVQITDSSVGRATDCETSGLEFKSHRRQKQLISYTIL